MCLSFMENKIKACWPAVQFENFYKTMRVILNDIWKFCNCFVFDCFILGQADHLSCMTVIIFYVLKHNPKKPVNLPFVNPTY